MASTTTEMLIKSYNVFMGRLDYENAYAACKVMWRECDHEEVYPVIKEFRKTIKNIVGCANLLKKAYLITARDVFDDFMIYLEWNRPIEQQFWLPRRKQLLPVAQTLQDLEEDKMDEVFIAMPPRVGKTTLIMFFVLWVMFRNSEISNLYCSYSDTVVGVFYNGLLEVLNDPITYLWQDIFPECTLARTDAKDLLIDLNRRKKYASFTGRSLYGTLNGACDCRGYSIADDLISGIEEAMNKDRLRSEWSKVDNNYLPRGVGDKVKRLWIGTRWSVIDPQGLRLDLLLNEPKYKSIHWKQINVPALNEDDESNFDYAFGLGFTTEQYQQRRASFERNNDMASWDAQYDQSPIERNGAVFSPGDMRFFNGVLPECDPDRIFMAVDPSWGGGDFVASPICVKYGEDIYVVDVVYDNRDKKVTQPLIVDKAIRYNVAAIRIEGTKMTADYAEGVDAELRKRNHRLNVTRSTKHYTGKGKEQRIFDKSPDIKERMVFLESGKRSKPYQLFMDNVYAFSVTGVNKHDDAPDSLAMAIDMDEFGETKIVIAKRVI